MKRSMTGWVLLFSFHGTVAGFASDVPEDFALQVEAVHFKGDRKPAIFTHDAYWKKGESPAVMEEMQLKKPAQKHKQGS